MSVIAWIIAAAVALILLFIIFRVMKSCLPKIVVGLLIIAAMAFLVYWYVIR
jgi:hypothetical protein